MNDFSTSTKIEFLFDPNQTIGQRIRDARKKKGMSADDLANVLRTSRKVISNAESGATYPSLLTLRGISVALNVSIDWLVFGHKRPNFDTPPGLEIK